MDSSGKAHTPRLFAIGTLCNVNQNPGTQHEPKLLDYVSEKEPFFKPFLLCKDTTYIHKFTQMHTSILCNNET